MATKKHTARDIPKLPTGIHCFDPTLYLRVQPTGARSWIQRITITRGGKPVDRGLGGWPVVTLEDARLQALSNRRAVRAGRNPFADRDVVNRRIVVRTFGAAADSLMDTLAGKAATTIKTYRSVIASLRRLSARPVASITRSEVIDALKGIASVSSRAKALKIARRVLDHAVTLDWVDGNVAQNGGIAAAVGIEAAQPGHHAAAAWRDCPGIFAAVSAVGSAAADCLTFIMLTAARLSEAAGARWDEINLDDATWTVPAGRMKTKREHVVPLSSAAVALLKRRQGQHEDLVFAGRAGKVPSQRNVGRIIKDHGSTTHGLRSSFRDWASDTGQSREAAEHALAHAVGNSVERCYARSTMIDARRPLMDAWCRFLTGGE